MRLTSWVAVTWVVALCAPAGAGTVALWTFENSHPTSAGPFAPEVGAGFATAHAQGNFQNEQAVNLNFIGNGSTWSWGSHEWNAGDYFQFEVSTLGLKDVHLDWDQGRSLTGPAAFALQYSTDGQSFTKFASYTVLRNNDEDGRTHWDSIFPRQKVYSFAFDLSDVGAVEDADVAIFRLSAINGGSFFAGTTRVDNFQVTAAAAIPLPAGVGTELAMLSLLCGAALVRRAVTIKA